MIEIRINSTGEGLDWLWGENDYWKDYVGCNDFDEQVVLFGNRDFNGITEASWYNKAKEILTNIDYYDEYPEDLSNIYIKTKFLAERLILENIINNNLNAKIIRLGNITNRYSDGAFQINVSENAFLNRIHSFIQIGYVPESLKNYPIEFSPVDVCALAIVNLTIYQNPFTIFHVFDQNYITFEQLVKVFNTLHVKLDFIDDKLFSQKVKELSNNSETKHIISGIINDFSRDKHIKYVSNIVLSNSFTNNYLRRILFRWPKINEKYLSKYVVYLKTIGYIKF